MDKFNRNYVLQVQASNGEMVVVQPPFTIDFDITRRTLSSTSLSSIRIYNLKPETRNRILKNQFDYSDRRLVILNAGYGPGPNYPTVFTGYVTQAWSVREGVNFITQIEAFDGGYAFANAQANLTFPANTPIKTIITALIKSLSGYGVQFGEVGNYEGSIPRSNSYTGRTTDVLRELTGGGFFIDNGKGYALKTNETATKVTPLATVISSQTGLLGTPVRQETLLVFTMLFEPTLALSQQIKLDSLTGQNFNTYYKVTGLHHRGTISRAVCGDATTEVEVLYGLTPKEQLQALQQAI